MIFQACKVNGPLGSVRKICQEGSRVVFDEAGSYIEDKMTKERAKIEDVGSSYVLTLRVPRGGNKEMNFARRG